MISSLLTACHKEKLRIDKLLWKKSFATCWKRLLSSLNIWSLHFLFFRSSADEQLKEKINEDQMREMWDASLSCDESLRTRRATCWPLKRASSPGQPRCPFTRKESFVRESSLTSSVGHSFLFYKPTDVRCQEPSLSQGFTSFSINFFFLIVGII